jgi:hypothetical protein
MCISAHVGKSPPPCPHLQMLAEGDIVNELMIVVEGEVLTSKTIISREKAK